MPVSFEMAKKLKEAEGQEKMKTTDLQCFVELYKSFGIELDIRKGENGFFLILDHYEKYPGAEKFEGYLGFYSRV